MKTIINHKGVTIIELLIATAILGLVLAALASLLVTQSKTYTTHGEIVRMQDNARAAMDFVTRTMKGLSGTTATNETACNSSITFTSTEDFGVSSGSSSTTLSDNTKSWTANEWQNFSITITAGTGSGQTRTISSNTSTQLTLGSSWTTVPDNTSEYRILSTNAFSLSGNTLRYTRNAASRQPLAENIACFTVQSAGSPVTRLNITISAETPNLLPDRGTKGLITLNSSVDLRN